MIVNLDCQKSIERIIFCLKNANGSIIVCEVNERPLVFDLFKEIVIDAEKIDVFKQKDYQKIGQNSPKKNIILYNFSELSDNTEDIANEINFSRDVFLRSNKNFVFVLPTYIVLNLMQDNVSFWSCVSLYERFVGSRSEIFNYVLDMELIGLPKSITNHVNYIKMHFCQGDYCNNKDCDFSLGGCLNRHLHNIQNDLRLLISCFFLCQRLFYDQLFEQVITFGSLLLSNIKKKDALYFQIKLLMGAAYYHRGEIQEAINFYSGIEQETSLNNFSEVYYSSVLNRVILSTYVDNSISPQNEMDLLKLQKNVEAQLNMFYNEREYVNDGKLKSQYFLICYNVSLCKFKQAKFQDALKTIDNALKMETSRLEQDKIRLKLLKVFIYTRLGNTSDALKLLYHIQKEIKLYHFSDDYWQLDITTDYCFAFVFFVEAKYTSVFKIVKQTNKKLVALKKSGYVGILPFKFFCNYLKAMALFYYSEDKKKVLEKFYDLCDNVPSENDLLNVRKIIKYINNQI